MTLGGFGSSNGFKDGVRYMMRADVGKLRTALANGDCSTSAFALCSMKDWISTSNKEGADAVGADVIKTMQPRE